MDALSKEDFDKLTWKIIDKYYGINKGYQLVKHQIESYNDFIENKLEQIIKGFNDIDINHQYQPETENFKYLLSIRIDTPVLTNPEIYEKDGSKKTMTPNDARQRNFTYSSNLTVNMHIKTQTWEDTKYIIENKTIQGVNLGKIPIMVKSNYCVLNNKAALIISGECKYDYGGYFIVNGNEKVVISQDRISENKTYVFLNNKVSTYSHIAEIRSVQENKLGVPKITTLKVSAKGNQFGRYIRVNIHHIKNDIPLFILFKALGLHNDKEIIKYIVYDLDDRTNNYIINELIGCIEESNNIMCQKDALEYLAKYLNITGYSPEILNNKNYRINIVRNVLEREFLPHVGYTYYKKALYLGYMVNKLIKCFLGLKEYDNRDSYINKRVDTPGVLMANLFRQYYGKVIKDMKNMIQKEIKIGGWKATNKFANVITKINVYKIIKSTIIDSGIRYALATGNWGIKNNKNKQGVAQVLNRMTYSATVSHLRRINTPIEKSGKLIQPRKLHSTQWGIICPSECFDPNTPILLWDGVIKKAQDIIVGDYLIDDKGNSVRVKSTCSGYKTMYDIIPTKNNFMSYTVTDNHILTLKARKYTKNTNKFRWFDKDTLKYKSKLFDNIEDLEKFKSSIDDVIDINIDTYLSLPINVQKELYTFKSDGINWEYKKVELDPYILGLWLAKGLSTGDGFVTGDTELLNKWIEWGADNDVIITKNHNHIYNISSSFINILNIYNLIDNKHIPKDYLVNDRKTRLSLLAGLIDACGRVRPGGHKVKITQDYDIEFLARSLGFTCYNNLIITGEHLYEIPTILPRKKLNKSNNPNNYLQSSFKLIKQNIQPFVGWQLEGNGRFLLGDMSMVHNTPEGSAIGLVKNLSMMASITICSNSENIRTMLTELGCNIFNGENIDIFYDNTKVIINGDIVGVHKNPLLFFNDLKMLKRKGCINIYTGVIWNLFDKEICICTEGGRCVRPLLIVDPVTNIIRLPRDITKKTWQDLIVGTFGDINVDDNIIEFLDVEEGNTSMIAMKYMDLFKGNKGSLQSIKYSHLEIHPSLILGVLASSIPFSDHNQAPRNCFPVEDHEVLTIHGFLGLTEILKYTADGKELAVACHVDGYLKYHKIGRDRVVYQDDQGNLLTATEFVSFESESKNISILTTPNHNMYGRLGSSQEYKTYEAHEIIEFPDQNNIFQLQCNFSKGITLSNQVLPFVKSLGLISDDHIEAFLWFYGYWLNNGNGWLEDGYITIKAKEQKDVDKLDEIFTRLCMPLLVKRKWTDYGYYKEEDKFSICNIEWLNYFSQQYGVNNTTWFWSWVYDSLNVSQLKIILSGLEYGNPKGIIIDTPSLDLCNEVEQLCILIGFPIEILPKYKIIYAIDRPVLIIKEEIKSIKFKNPKQIFCVSVPTKSHLIMVRRRSDDDTLASRATIVGNTYQSLKQDTPVLMADNTYKMIKDIKVGEEVQTFDPITKYVSKTKVINQYVRPTNNKIFEITTISGRKITATDNHHFMTNQGWCEVQHFNDQTCIGISMEQFPLSIKCKTEFDVLNTEIYKDILIKKYELSELLLNKHLNDLNNKDLLNIKNTNTKLHILSRITGFLMTDGEIYKSKNAYSMQACFGTELSAKMFEDDIEYLGLNRSKITYTERDLNGSKHTAYNVRHGGIAATLFLALGVAEVHHLSIPKWIMNGTDMIKREFLAGYQGGDGCTGCTGCTIQFNNYVCAETNQDSLKIFFEQMHNLYTDLGIETEIQTPKYAIKICDTPANLLKYFDTIGYRYDYHKITKSAVTIEYIRYKNILIEEGKTISDNITNWFNKIKQEGQSMFIPIKSIIEVENQLISDITTESENHSFIAGDNFLSHNSAQAKQAIGIYASNYKNRYDTMGHILNSPQKPLVRTKMATILNQDKMPNGINAIVAIACYTGFNMEDSVLINKSAVDRGLFVSTYFRTYKEQNNKNHSNGEEEFFVKPEIKGIKPFNYSKIDESGFVPENTFIENGDIIIGKCMPNKNGNVISYKDNSIPFKNGEMGYIDRNCANDKYFTNTNGDGYTFAKVRVRNDRHPTIGDKLSCYDAETEILTTDGWLYFKDLTIDHNVATLVDNTLIYQKPIKIIADKYNGPMYKVENNQIDLMVTPNHRMYVKSPFETEFKMKLAENIYGTHQIYKKNADNYIVPNNADNIIWNLNQEQSKKIISNICDSEYKTFSTKLADDFMRLCLHAGWSANKYLEPTDNSWTLTINKNNNNNILLLDKYRIEDSWIDYQGIVYCCEVPIGEGIVYVRRSGKPCWSGNSRSAQKGTCGMLYEQADMPFTKDGISPDIIMNPHAIPSRMTMGQLLECVMGKACCFLGNYGDATPFNELHIEDIADILQKCGMERYGNEVMYNSRTGEQINTDIFIGPTYYQRLKHMTIDKVHCFLNNHDVLTMKGWVSIEKVTKEDQIACLKNNELVYEHPLDVLHFPNYKGKIYKIKNSSIELEVTANHRMYVSKMRNHKWLDYKLVEAESIMGEHVRYKKNAEWNQPDYQFILPAYLNQQEKILDMDSWLGYLGIWYAEGWAYNGKSKKYVTSVLIFKQRIKDVIFEFIEKMNYNYKIFKKGTQIDINDKQLHNYMKILSVGAPQKTLPDWVWKLSKEQCRKLLHGMCLGDGTFDKNERTIYYTSSVKLADDFMRLCLHCGWAGTISTHIKAGQTTPNNFDILRISVIKSKLNPTVNHAHVHEQNIQEEELYDYEGSVYCLTVPSEVFYIRKNRKACWTGNSRANNGPIVNLTRQPSDGRARSGGLRLGEMEIECLWTHGTLQFLKERIMECSDNYRVFVCRSCGLMAIVNPLKKIYCCRSCKNNIDFAEIRIPYCAKLLLQEIQTMSIATRFLTIA
jgi:DNA-directed RNA polymerase beta subunit